MLKSTHICWIVPQYLGFISSSFPCLLINIVHVWRHSCFLFRWWTIPILPKKNHHLRGLNNRSWLNHHSSCLNYLKFMLNHEIPVFSIFVLGQNPTSLVGWLDRKPWIRNARPMSASSAFMEIVCLAPSCRWGCPPKMIAIFLGV